MAARRWRHLQLARPWLPLLVSCASGTCCSSVVLQDPEGSSGLSSPPSRPTCIHPLLQDPEGTLRGPLSTPGVEDPGGSGAFLLSLLQRPWFFDNQSTRTQSLIINMYGTVPTCFFNCIIQFLTDSGLYCPPCFFFLCYHNRVSLLFSGFVFVRSWGEVCTVYQENLSFCLDLCVRCRFKISTQPVV